MANFGTIGDLNSYRGGKPDLPQWLLDQMSVNNTTDESGQSKTEYSFNNNPYGGFQRDGKYYVQVGSNKLKDPSKVTTDPELGDITEVGNVNDITPQGPNYAMLAAVIGAGLLGGAAGLGAEAGSGGGVAAAGLAGDESAGLLGTGSYSGVGALAGDESAGLSMANPFAQQGGLLAGDESAGLNMASQSGNGGLLSGSGLSGGDLPYGTEMPNVYDVGANPAAYSPTAPLAGTPWYQTALANMAKDPLSAARLGLGVYQLGSSLAGGKNVGGSPGSPGGSGPGGSVTPNAKFNPLQSGVFVQNPYLLQQMFKVPFMGGSRGF